MKKKIYYWDNDVKITGLEISSGELRVPIEQIRGVKIGFKFFTAAAALIFLVFSMLAVPFLCCFHGSCGYICIIFPLAALLWLWWSCRTYFELKISTDTGKLKLFDAGMNERKQVFRIEEILKTALKEKENGS